MTNKITNYEMWANLEGRYALEARGESAPKLLSDVVVAVADADAALAQDEIQQVLLDLSGTIGNNVEAFSVPDGEEWRIWMVIRGLTIVTSAVVFTGQRRGGTFNTSEITLRLTPAEIIQYDRLTCKQGGGGIGMRATGNAGDDNVVFAIFYQRFLVTP